MGEVKLSHSRYTADEMERKKKEKILENQRKKDEREQKAKESKNEKVRDWQKSQ